MWVKICGITDRATAEHAVEQGADAVGLVLASSPRQVTVAQAAAIVDNLDIETFVLTVDQKPDVVLRLAHQVGATGIQPYGMYAAASAQSGSEAGYRVLRPVAVGDVAPSVADIPTSQTILADTASDSAHGGTGTTFDWRLVRELDRPFVLAGGLTPESVSRAVTLANPVGVDVSSGVESAPGIKNAALIAAFIERART